jgi:hypothetical protein
VGGVEVVLGGDDLVAAVQLDAVVDQAQAHRGAVGERDLDGIDVQVVGGRGAHLLLLAGELVERAVGVDRQRLAVAGDGVGHLLRRRGEDEGGEVAQVGGERELGAHRVPVLGVEVVGRGAGTAAVASLVVAAAAHPDGGRAGQRAGAGQEVTSCPSPHGAPPRGPRARSADTHSVARSRRVGPRACPADHGARLSGQMTPLAAPCRLETAGGFLHRPGTPSDAPDSEIRTPDPQDTP